MLLKRTNIKTQLVRERDRQLRGASILDQVQAILRDDELHRDEILKRLQNPATDPYNTFDFDQLNGEQIFHIDQIKKICIDYRLRFLDTKYFKGDFPQEALSKIKHLEQDHQIQLRGFKIVAPSKMFVLRKTDDPLLFAPMGNDYYYLIHQWGNDLHPLRKLMMWPYKNLENLIATVILVSLIATWLMPDGLFAREQTLSQDIMVFFFMFKSIAAVVIYYGFAMGKNFNTAIWRSQFDKS
ncbi:hypothetical protein [Croceiramulus getboli]|nr:hypothetical protein P8624_13820 [Flavobacteriaceae bacterium YJPT1-3]